MRHQLLVLPGTKPEDLKRVTSHTHALGQCRRVTAEMGLEAVVAVDTAGAAAALARVGDRSTAVIASKKAAEIYGLEVMRADIEDEDHNTTRFVIMSAEPDDATPDDAPVITSFIFTVRNVPAALFKAMGGFATNGVNMIKLESYVDGHSTWRSSMPTSKAIRRTGRFGWRLKSWSSSPIPARAGRLQELAAPAGTGQTARGNGHHRVSKALVCPVSA